MKEQFNLEDRMQKNKWVAGMCLVSMAIFVFSPLGYADGDGIITVSMDPGLMESAFTSPDGAASDPALDAVNFLETLGEAVAAAVDGAIDIMPAPAVAEDPVATEVPAVTSGSSTSTGTSTSSLAPASLVPASSEGPVLLVPPSTDDTTVTTTSTTGSGAPGDPIVTTEITTYTFNQGLSRRVTTTTTSTDFQPGPLFQATIDSSEIKFAYSDRATLLSPWIQGDIFINTSLTAKRKSDELDSLEIIKEHSINGMGTRSRSLDEKQYESGGLKRKTLHQDTRETNSFTPTAAGPIKLTGFIEIITYSPTGFTDQTITFKEDGSRVKVNVTQTNTRYMPSLRPQMDKTETITETYDPSGTRTGRTEVTYSTLWHDSDAKTAADRSFLYTWVDAAGVTLFIIRNVQKDDNGNILSKSFKEERTDASGTVIESVSAIYFLDYTFMPPKLTVVVTGFIPGTIGLTGLDYRLAVRRWVDGLVGD